MLTRSSGGTILALRLGARMAIHGLHISGATNSGGAIVLDNGELALVGAEVSSNQGIGVEAKRGVLRIARSVIAGNAGGGVQIDGSVTTLELVGNLFIENGSDANTSGALRISASQAAVKRVELNSFHGNRTLNGGAANHCEIGQIAARNNIVSGTQASPQQPQLGGSCTHASSIFYLLPDGIPPGPGNTYADPRFVNPTGRDLHLQPDSPARRAADPTSDLTGLAERDLDGDLRTHPADIGADEAP